MRLAFQVVLAIFAALTVSMVVSADSECQYGSLCNSKADCCLGYNCVLMNNPKVDEPDLIYGCAME
ncbi:hypothetical protein BDR07DRAFT_1396091 [Suillus spraguei]|nr:hypothetical protein BDR07DRAFT_1396091 [Suillus spraguei]